jgi:hypothetical protein
MQKFKISQTKDYFIHGSRKVFCLADTVWSAFKKISIEEWEAYLEYRKTQNFNVLQINILNQYDAGEKGKRLSAFNYLSDGTIDYFSFNKNYFEKAEKMLEMAVEKGFIPALVVLWGNYVEGTWQSKLDPAFIMPFGAVKTYAEYVAKTFSKYNPLYLISGDTDLCSDEAIKYYKTALDTIKAISPEALTTLHIQGCKSDLPDLFVESKNLDFYMYQSSHSIEGQHLAHQLAGDFYNKPVKRPIINGEPCYEGHGYGFKYGRFNAFDVRKAMWQSILAGAKAGITYGAHGVWSWHTAGSKFEGEEYSSTPYDWRTALHFEGAWDAAYLKWLFELYDMFDIEPQNELLMNKTEEIRISTSIDQKKIFIYVPYTIEVKLKFNLNNFEMVMIDLSNKMVLKPKLELNENISIIKMHDLNSDVLIIGIASVEKLKVW